MILIPESVKSMMTLWAHQRKVGQRHFCGAEENSHESCVWCHLEVANMLIGPDLLLFHKLGACFI